MFNSKIKRSVSKLLVIAMLLTMMPFLQSFVEPNHTDLCNLSDFVRTVNVYDMSGDELRLVDSNENLLPGKEYMFVLKFFETYDRRFEFTKDNKPHPDGLLIYRLPEQFEVSISDDILVSSNDEIEAEFKSIGDFGFIYFKVEADDGAVQNHSAFGNISHSRALAFEADELEYGDTSDVTTQERTPSSPQSDESAANPSDSSSDDLPFAITPPPVSEYDDSQNNDNAASDNLLGFTAAFSARVSSGADGYIFISNEFVLSVGTVPTDFSDIASAIGDLAAYAAGDLWDLATFLQSVVMWDMSVDPPAIVDPNTPTWIGQNYRFVITFAEDADNQLQYNPAFADSAVGAPNGKLVYQLPSALIVQAAVAQTPIQIANGSIVGWYTIGLDGQVLIWFADVDQFGNSTPGTNYIALTDVRINLEVWAQLTDGDVDFGNDVVINVPRPEYPPPGLDITKFSRYDEVNDIIYYMVEITALGVVGGAGITDISFIDTPRIQFSNAAPLYIIEYPLPDTRNAFSAATFQVNRVNAPPDSYNPMPWAWNTILSSYTYDFGTAPEVTLNPGDKIVIRFSLDVEKLIQNNIGSFPAGQTELNYNFNILNAARIKGNNTDDGSLIEPPDANVDNNVSKVFPVSKSGEYIAPVPPDTIHRIRWTATVGDGLTTELNNGTVTDTQGPPVTMVFPDPSQIAITFYGANNTILGTTNLGAISGFTINPNDAAANDVFTFTVPDDLGQILRLVIVYDVEIPNPALSPDEWVSFFNTISFGIGDTDVANTGRVPFGPGFEADISKTTSGLCGQPGAADGPNGESYWVNYTINLHVGRGAINSNLYIFDNLGIMPGGSGVLNNPGASSIDSLTVTASEVPDGASSTAVGVPITNFPYTIHYPGRNTNEFRVYFGGSNITGPGDSIWNYTLPVNVVVSYRIWIPDDKVATLKSNQNNYLQNASYAIADSGDPILSGENMNQLDGTNVNDRWPIFKSVQATDNPSLFNYTVLIRGDAFATGRPLMDSKPNPIFSDSHDPNLEYVPGTFYIVDTTANPVRYFAIPSGDVTIGSASGQSGFTANLNRLAEFNAPPSQGGTVIDAAPGMWWSQRHNFEVHYQMSLSETALAWLNAAQAGINLPNTAAIQVNEGECKFENSSTVHYVPTPLSKSMSQMQPGSNIMDFQIVVNPDGSFIFADTGLPPPSIITAEDVLHNLMMYLDTIVFYTQDRMPGNPSLWNGVWRVQPTAGFNLGDTVPWSVNVISESEIHFTLPNATPVKIAYSCLVTLPPGQPDDVWNEVSLVGKTAGSQSPGYEINDNLVGAGASEVPLRVFKRDTDGTLLSGSWFDLYVTNAAGDAFSMPSGLVSTDTISVAGHNFYRIDAASGVMTDSAGMAVLSDPWLATSHYFVFLIVETQAPLDYYTPVGAESYTFVTINPKVNTVYLSGLLGGVSINSISDFTGVENVKSVSITINKSFGYGNPYSHTDGLPAGLVPSPIAFTIIGPMPTPLPSDTSTIPRQTRWLDMSRPNADGTFSLTFEDLSPGNYNVVESGGFLFGYRKLAPGPGGSFTGLIPAGTDYTVPIVNIYDQPANLVPPVAVTPTIMLAKIFHGLTPDQVVTMQNNIQLRLTSDNPDFNSGLPMLIDGATTGVTAGTIYNGGLIIDNLPSGTYTIDELGGAMSGLNLTTRPTLPVTFIVDGYSVIYNGENQGLTLALFIENIYEQAKGQMRIQKIFTGLPPAAFPPDFKITVTNLATREQRSVTAEQALAGYLLENMDFGRWVISEVNPNYPGYEFFNSTPALPLTIVISAAHVDRPFNFRVVNNYEEIPSLKLEKEFILDGSPATLPLPFAIEPISFTIHGPNGFLGIATLNDFISGSFTIAAVPGTYTIYEVGGKPLNETIEYTPGISPQTIVLEWGDHGIVTFTNRYTMPPLPPTLVPPDTTPGGPRTGDDGNLLLWIGILLAATACITATLIWRKHWFGKVKWERAIKK